MGFQDMPKVVHEAASAKGGRVKARKGLAAMSPEKRREVQSKGGKTTYENRSRKGAKQTQEGTGGSPSVLESVLGNIDNGRDDSNTRSDSEPKK